MSVRRSDRPVAPRADREGAGTADGRGDAWRKQPVRGMAKPIAPGALDEADRARALLAAAGAKGNCR